jgi:hypothetical protein
MMGEIISGIEMRQRLSRMDSSQELTQKAGKKI